MNAQSDPLPATESKETPRRRSRTKPKEPSLGSGASSKIQQPTQTNVPETKEALCQVILAKGTRRNQRCNRKIERDDLCRMHLMLELKKPENPYIDFEKVVTCVNGQWTDGQVIFPEEYVQLSLQCS